MKTNLIAIILLGATFAGCKPKKTETTVLGFGTPYLICPEYMNGRVKEVKETVFWSKIENGQITKGSPVKWKQLDSIKFSHSFIARYSENGASLGCDYLNEDGTINLGWKSTIEKGKIVRISGFIKDSITYYGLLLYDENNCQVGLTLFSPRVDTILSKWIITNNNKCQYSMIEYLDYKNRRTGRNEFTLNQNGRVIDRKYYNKSDSLIYHHVLTYNNRNFLISEEIFTKGKSNGKYNYKYTYDNMGNWKTEIVYIDTKLKLFVERTFVYY